MENDRELLEWGLRFAQMDLESLRAGDWMNLSEDLRDLLQWPSIRQEPTRDDIRAVQREVKAALNEIVDKNTPSPGERKDEATAQPSLERQVYRHHRSENQVHMLAVGDGTKVARLLAIPAQKVEYLYLEYPKPGSPRLRASGGLREELLILLVVSPLLRLEITHLRRCPVCFRLFYAEHGRQLFCTPQCASREGTRRFREKQREEEAGRERSNYENQMKGKLRPTAPMARRKKSAVTKEK
jgi:hypothetical protein